jgi:hypothetical protein
MSYDEISLFVLHWTLASKHTCDLGSPTLLEPMKTSSKAAWSRLSSVMARTRVFFMHQTGNRSARGGHTEPCRRGRLLPTR